MCAFWSLHLGYLQYRDDIEVAPSSQTAQVVYTWGKGEADREQGWNKGLRRIQDCIIYLPVWEMSTSSYKWNFLRSFPKLDFFVFAWNKDSGERDMTLPETVEQILIGV